MYDVLALEPNFFSDTRCLFLNACSVGDENQNAAGNTMLKAFKDTGIDTVVGYVNVVYFRENNGIVDLSFGSERWAKVFVCGLSNGLTVQNAKNAAVADAIESLKDLEELDEEKQYEDAFAEAQGYGLVDIAIEGNANQIVKH